MKKSRNKVLLLSVCSAALLLTGCQNKEEAKKMSTTIHVNTGIAQTGTLELTSDYIGTASPGEEVMIIPLVAGKVKTVKVKEGDHVKKGDVLCKFDDTAAQFSVKNAEIAVKSAKDGKKTAQNQANLSAAQTQGSIQSLYTQLNGYQKSLSDAENQRNLLNKNLSQLKSNMDSARTAVQNCQTTYKTAQALYINYRVFLTTYPDCQTTVGLKAAAKEATYSVPNAGGSSYQTNSFDYETYFQPQSYSGGSAYQTVRTSASGLGLNSANGSGDTSYVEEGKIPVPPSAQTPSTVMPKTVSPSTPTALPSPYESTPDSGVDMPDITIPDTTDPATAGPSQKTLTAQSLLDALNKSNLTVEYLNEAGLSALKENVSEAQNAYNGAATAYNEARTGSGSIDSTISTLRTQIKGLKESIATAENTQGLANKAAKDSVAAVDNQIDAAKVGLDSAEYQVDLYTVEAPMDGVVESVNVKKDEIFGNSMPAFTISDKNSATITFYVTEDARDFLEMGDEANVESNGHEYVGNVTEISTAADQQRGLFEIKANVSLKKGENISTGSSAKVTLVTSKSTGGLMIPYDSVYFDDNQAYVFVVNNDKATRTDVETGLYNEDTIEILSGLEEGDEVITSWASGLKNGAKIKRQVQDKEKQKDKNQ